MSFAFFVLFLVMSLFKMFPSCSVEMLSNVPKHKKAVMHLIEKIHVLGKFCSDMSYNVAGSQFNSNESTIYIKGP